jgi:hypothetical protein
MSVVVSGPPSNPKYSLKPVMHLFEDPLQAATIEGSIHADSFVDKNNVIIIVLDEKQEEFTRLEVEKEDDTEPTEFSIFWLVPNKSYTVQIDLNYDDTETIANDCEEPIDYKYLEPGVVFYLNDDQPLEDGIGICI